MQQQQEQMQELRKQEAENRREAMQKIRTDYDAQMKKILTSEQYKKYTALEEEQRKNMQNNGQRGPRGPRPGGESKSE